MELIGKLKEKVDQAETMEEKKAILEEAGVALSADELEIVAGGIKDWHKVREWNPHINKS